MTAQQPFRQSADPLSENSRISWNYREWDCGLAGEPTGHHYTRALRPTHPTSGNQNDHTQACSSVGLHQLAEYYTSSELVQCFLTGVILPNWCRAARQGSAAISLEQQWGRPRRAWACCKVTLHY